ncbi:MAG TPA: FoF1 ATP synthase subunit gamma, partial [Phycisphaerales bacterium]|nr:FoF1 ATP synthase subunit gamma [Phycisphaerales bacterium]
SNTQLDLETSGKKAVGFFKFLKIDIAQRHTIGDKPKFEDVEKIADRFMSEFSAGKYDAIYVVYMRFETNSRQIPEVMQLLPLKPPASASTSKDGAAKEGGAKEAGANYEFSPNAEELLASLLPAAVKASLFQAFNDSVVSEQIMRMIAMKAATENAKELGKLLKRRYNRARQAQITTELTEIVSGAAALN